MSAVEEQVAPETGAGRPPSGHVLWASTSLQTRGGMTTFVDTMSRTPLWDGWNIDFVATHRSGSLGTRAATFARGLAGFVRRLVGRRPDIIHLHTSYRGSFVRKAVLLWSAAIARIPVVLHIHAGEFPAFHDRAPRPMRWFIRRTLTRAGTVVALGHGLAHRLSDIAPDARVMAIPNGIPIIGQNRRDDNRPVHVVFLGQIGDSKGTFTLLDAWAKLVTDGSSRTSARLTIAGDGEVDRARAAVAHLGLAESVQVRSWLSSAEVADLLGAADVLTLPSRHEGQPMAILEAMARGLCVVASAVGGIPDLIEHGTSGVLVSPDDVDALATGLRRVIDDPAERHRLGDAALERARQTFDVDVIWRRFDALYRRLMDPAYLRAGRSPAFRRRVRRSGPLRVQFIVPGLGVGGAERHLLTLLPAMDRSRFAPSLISIGRRGELFAELVAAGVPARALGRSKRESGRALAELVAHMRRTRPDVVVVQGYNAEVLGRIAALLSRVPRTVVWLHHSSDITPRGRVQRVADRVLQPATSAYYGVARGQVPYFTEVLGFPPSKVRIVHNGTDPELFPFVPVPPRGSGLAASLGIGPEHAVVGIVAVLRPEKDHATFFRAARIVIDQLPRARFLVVGDGTLRAELSRLVDELGIAEKVIFTGSRSDVGELLSLVDVFALTSLTECFPMSVLEAMAIGRPAVCTAVGGIPEILDEGVTGYMVRPRDPAGLAERLLGLLSDPVRARAMGRAARARVESEFTLDRSVRDAESTIEETAGRGPSGARTARG